MGVVYKAIDARLGRVVALKFLPPHLSADPHAKERFITEARSASLLDHPNIATIYEIDEEPDAGLFIAMAYYEGAALDRLLSAGPVPFDRAVEVVAQVGDALARAHARGIVHRDIKPANILMTSTGVAKVIDFGIAKIASSNLTGTGSTPGTPAYMSPEQIRGKADHRTDIWALGVVFFEMLTGYLPFAGENAYAQTTAILDGTRLPCGDWVPKAATDMIDRMLAKSVSERYQSMDSVVADARSLLGATSTITGPGWLNEVAERAPSVMAPPPATNLQTILTSEQSAERRQVTVLASGLQDLPALADSLDPEDLHEVLLTYQTVCGEIARRFDGHLTQATDDEVIVYFGYPTAHEDDGGRAVRCALEIADAVKSIPMRLAEAVPSLNGLVLHAAIGVHTGTIITGDRRGGRAPGLTGNVASVASRTRENAAAGQVVVTTDTYRIVRRAFYCEELGTTPGRGTKGIATYRVVSEVTGALGHTRELRDVAPAIGREHELEMLLERWKRVRDGMGQVVLLGGEAGIGKSRLLTTLRAAVKDEPHLLLDCQCSAYHVNSPLHPFIELLRRLFALERAGLSDADKLQLLTSALAHHGMSAPAEQSLFASLLSLPAVIDRDTLRLGVQQLKARTLRALSKLLLQLGDGAPVLIVIEDLHWVDPTSLEVLGLILDASSTSPVLVVLTFRPEFVAPWADRPHVAELSLARLSGEQTRVLVRQVTGGKSLPAEVMAQIVATTDGIPLFVEELTKTLLESGALRETPEGYELTAPLASIDVPTTVLDSLMSRLDRLPGAKPVAQIASVLGRDFPYGWLSAVSMMTEATLQQELGRLVRAGLLEQRGVAPLASFRFKHALVKDAAYHSLLRADRQDFHRRVADTLVEKSPTDARIQPEIIAHHYTEAAQADPAARFWQMGGQRALERSHDVEAVAHFTRGLEMLRKLPLDAGRQKRELSMQVGRAAALRATRGFAAAITGEAYMDARALAVAVGDSNALITALNGLYAYHMVRAEHSHARPVAEGLVHLADQLGDPTHQMVGHRALGAVLFHIGNPESGRTYLERALAAYDPEKHSRLAPLFGTDHAETVMSFLSLVLWVQGRPDQALSMQLGALAHSEQLGHLHTLAQALTFLCFVRLLRREPGGVLEAATRLVAMSDEHSFPLMAASGRFWGAWAVSERGDRVRGIRNMETAAGAWWATGAQTYRSFAETLMAEAYLRSGDLDGSGRLLQTASDRIAASDERWAESELLRVRGEHARASGDSADSLRLFQTAMDCAAKQGAHMWSLRAAQSLCRHLLAERPDADIHTILAPLLAAIPEGADTADVIEARQLLGLAGDAPTSI
jgi:class 3 adenylate cyclase/predicted ATPase